METGKIRVSCIVPSAGRGRRLGRGKEKPFLKLNGKPIISHTLSALQNSPSIDDIIVVVSPSKVKECRGIVKKYNIKKVRSVIPGGRMRYDSVKNGLKNLKAADFVLIHDGARPFIDKKTIKNVLKAARSRGAAISAIPSKQTLKSVGRKLIIDNTPDRKRIWEAQTPQAFRKELILEAYDKAKTNRATDDSSLAEALGYKVKVVKGSYRNIKITTPEDLELAKLLSRRA